MDMVWQGKSLGCSGCRCSCALFGGSTTLGCGRCISLCLCGFLFLGSLSSSWFSVVSIRRSPQGEVVTEELHDESAIAVRFLGQGVKFSDGIIECLLSQMACAIWRVQDLVVEDREIEGKTQTDRVSWSKLGLCDISSILFQLGPVSRKSDGHERYLVCLMGGSCSNLALLAGSKFSKVTMIVTLPVNGRQFCLITVRGTKHHSHLVVEDL